MAFIHPLTAKAAKAILKERGLSMQEFRRTGKLDLAIGVRMTVVGRCTYQIVDDSSVGGEGVAPFVSPAEQRSLPACQSDCEGTYEERRETRIEALAKHHALQALLHG